MKLLNEWDKSFDNLYVIGIDETGVGDYFSPLISCAVLVEPESIEKLRLLGVKDSKKLSDSKIQFLAKEIKKYIKHYKFYKLTPKGYNSLNSFGFNANELKYISHRSTLNNLIQDLNTKNIKHDLVIIDQYSTFNSITKYHIKISEYMQKRDQKYIDPDVDVLYKTGAESVHIAVACASILARNEFLTFMQNLNEQYGFEFPLGASNTYKIAETIKKIGSLVRMKSGVVLSEICKLHFLSDEMIKSFISELNIKNHFASLEQIDPLLSKEIKKRKNINL
ncbi:ribonuclease HIII [Mycoplasma corogypsi]|uniref:ribonuclease HIII n=1 Tax=Mycoplasma corogypsi TaxID=2106 RepID=UPI003873B922